MNFAIFPFCEETTINAADYHDFNRGLATRYAIFQTMALTSLCILVSVLTAKSITSFIGRVKFELDQGSTVLESIRAASSALTVGLVFTGIILWLVYRISLMLGQNLAVRRRSADAPVQGLRDGVNSGWQKTELLDDGIHFEMAKSISQMHLAAFNKVHHRGGLVILPQKNDLFNFFPAKGGNAGAKKWVNQLRPLWKKNRKESWDVSTPTDAWDFFDIARNEFDRVLDAYNATKGVHRASTFRIVFSTFDSLILFIGIPTIIYSEFAERLSAEAVGLTILWILYLPYGATVAVQSLRELWGKMGVRPKPLGGQVGVNCGPGTMTFDDDGITIHRALSRRRHFWRGLDFVLQRGEHLLFVSGNRVIEMVPICDNAINSMRSAGMKPQEGPWANLKEDITWVHS